MDWSKAKTILILVFFITNIFLLFQTFQSREDHEVPTAIIEGTRKVMESNRIFINTQIPTTRGIVEEATFTYGVDFEKVLKGALGPGYKKAEDKANDYYSGNRYVTVLDDGSILLQDSSCRDLLLQDRLFESILFQGPSQQEASSRNTFTWNALQLQGKKLPDPKELEKDAKELAYHYGIDTAGFVMEKWGMTGEGLHILLRGVHKNIKIYNNYIDIRIEGEDTLYLKWFAAKPANLPYESGKVLAVTDILLGNLVKIYPDSKQKVSINHMELYYYLDPNMMDSQPFDPHMQTASLVWRITLQDAEGEKDLLFSAYTAELLN